MKTGVNSMDLEDFNKAFDIIIGVEGGFSDDINDNGNWTGGVKGKGILKGTKYGVSAASFPTLDIQNLTKVQAKEIYYKNYWDATGCTLQCIKYPLNVLLFDAAVQHGAADAKKLLQRTLNLAEDGVFGSNTKNTIAKADTNELCAKYLTTRLKYYQSLRLWSTYGNGWSNRLFKVAIAC